MSLQLIVKKPASVPVTPIPFTPIPLTTTSAVGDDRFSSAAECSRALFVRVINWYLANLTVCAQTNPAAASAIRNVVNFEVSPETLWEPRLVARVLAAALSRRAARNRAVRLDAADRGAF